MMKIILSGIFANLLVTIWSDRETFVAYSREIMKSTKSTAKVGASKDTTKSMDRHGVTTFSRWGVEQPVAGYKDIVASRKMFLSASMDPSSRPPNESSSPLSLFFTFVTCLFPRPHLSRSQSFFLLRRYPIYTLHFLPSQFTILI